MDLLAEPGLYQRQLALGQRLMDGLRDLAEDAGLPVIVEGLGTVFQLWFTEHPIRNWRDAQPYAREDMFTTWWQEMLLRGVLFHPSRTWLVPHYRPPGALVTVAGCELDAPNSDRQSRQDHDGQRRECERRALIREPWDSGLRHRDPGRGPGGRRLVLGSAVSEPTEPRGVTAALTIAVPLAAPTRGRRAVIGDEHGGTETVAAAAAANPRHHKQRREGLHPTEPAAPALT